MLEQVEKVLREHCGLSKDRLIVVGLSGGPDSLCLLHLLARAGYPIRAAHFNHHLRPESGLEAAKVAEIAAGLGIEFVLGEGDVRGCARDRGLSIEAAARELRYGFLFSQARACGAQALAVGHTADDQVETILMHFVRGSGLRGLGGMSHRTIVRTLDPSIPIVRPLLDVWHAETEQYCESNGLVPLRDASNASVEFMRNRIRLELIPLLETYNPQIRQTILRNSSVLASDQALLDELLNTPWREVVFRGGETFLAFDLARLEQCSLAVRRQLLLRAARHLEPGEQIDSAVLNRALEFISGSRGRRADFAAGLSLYRESSALYMAKSGAELPAEAWPQLPLGVDSLAVSIPGRVALSDGWLLETNSYPRTFPADAEVLRSQVDRFCADMDRACLPSSLQVRVRRPGDRIQPLGLGGHSQKLSDFFVNAKVPARARGRWPLVCSGETVVWVPGVRMAEPFRLTAESRQVARFCLKPPAPG